jgi:cysteine-rich repeat protein
VPGGSVGFHDPARAYSGTRVLGMGLSASDGGYHPDRVSWVESPTIPTGQWSDVRLQYRRWLTVADGFFDQARVVVNGEQAWANLSSHGDSNHYSHHEDRAWVFNDLSLSSRIFAKEVKIRWELDADDEFELGGWNLDDVCVVANIHSVCGDGVKTINEQCDEGAANADVPDTCRTTCRLARCGDGIVDQNEACDDGNHDESDDCTEMCDPIDHPDVTTQPGGCCSASAGPGGAALPSALVVLGLGLLGLAARRRTGGPRRARAR